MITEGHLVRDFQGRRGGRGPAIIDIAQDHVLHLLATEGLFDLGISLKGGTALRKFEAGNAGPEGDHMSSESPGIDVRETQVRKAIAAIEADSGLVNQMRDHGVPWWEVQRRLANALPEVMPWEERKQLAYSIVPRAINEVIGPEGIAWHSAKAPRPDGSAITTWILPGRGDPE